MAITTTTLKGLVFDVLIEEFADRDATGRLNAYLASVYTREKGTMARRLVRRSRLPGFADLMKHEVERDGLLAFRRLDKDNI